MLTEAALRPSVAGRLSDTAFDLSRNVSWGADGCGIVAWGGVKGERSWIWVVVICGTGFWRPCT